MGITFSTNRIAQESQKRGVSVDKMKHLFLKLSFNILGPYGMNPALTTVVSE